MARWVQSVALLLAVGCGSGEVIGLEPFADAEIRAILVLSPTGASAQLVPGDAAFRLPLGDEEVEVWLFAYSLATLAETFPGLSGLDASEVARELTVEASVTTAAPAPQTNRVARTALSAGSSEVRYVIVDWPTWQARVAAGGPVLSLRPTKPKSPCEVAKVTPLTVPIDVGLGDAVFTGENSALMFGPVYGGSDQRPMVVARWDGDAVTRLPEDPALTGRPNSAVNDGKDALYVVGSGGAFRLRLAGQLVERVRLPWPVARVDRGFEGAPWFAGDGIAVSTATAAAPTVVADYRWGAESVFARASDEIFTFEIEHSVGEPRHIIRGFDGTAWTHEHAVAGFDELHGLSGDANSTLAWGLYELMLARGDDGMWRALPQPFARSLHFRDVASLGGGRFIAALSSGFNRPLHTGAAAIWDGEAWCALDVGPVRRLLGVAVSPDKRTALVVGERQNGDGSPHALRIELAPSR